MTRARLRFLGAMGIFGTVGVFVRYIPLPSATVACCRGLLGLGFLVLVMLMQRRRLTRSILPKLPVLILSGAAMGFNWILLFESYRYTTVATATICYYLAPLLLLLMSPLLGEKLKLKHLLCVSAALVGLALMSGITEGSVPAPEELRGIGLGLGAAVLYATVMLLNKTVSHIPDYDKTTLQLGSAALVLLPYILLTGQADFSGLTATQWLLLITVGILHTGIAYTLYFGAVGKLNARTVAVLSYLDPVIAVLLSVFILGEKMSSSGIIGTVLILSSALCSELPDKKGVSR